jgi:hypothetical protein
MQDSHNLIDPQQDPEQAEQELARLMKSFQVKPGQRFYDRMQKAPWHPVAAQLLPRRLLAGAALLVLLLFTTLLVSPSLRAAAQQGMRYFFASPTESLALRLVIPEGPGGTDSFDVREFPLSLAEVEALADYPIASPAVFPRGWEFAGANYIYGRQEVLLKYARPRESLVLSQRPLGELREYARIGPGAPVETISIRGVEAELVKGGWRLLSGELPKETPPPGTEITLNIVWDPAYPQVTLRWHENDMLYELTLSGEGPINEELLVQTAQTIEINP